MLFVDVICIHTIPPLEWDSISKRIFTTVSIWRADSFWIYVITHLLNIRENETRDKRKNKGKRKNSFEFAFS